MRPLQEGRPIQGEVVKIKQRAEMPNLFEAETQFTVDETANTDTVAKAAPSLPEKDADQALATLADLDREKKLLSRDITAIDLRLPDRVTVRLSDEAAQAREEALKPKAKRKGGAV